MGSKVSLCMIVRNEEANLAGCLTEIAGYFSEIVVVDTGSTDDTKKLAASFGARVFEFPWVDDFAAARNECCQRATGDWIMWLDADDRIDPANRALLAGLLQNIETLDPQRNCVFTMSCVSKIASEKLANSVTHSRLFPRRSDLEWQGRVHERLEFAGDEQLLKYVPTDIAIRHEGYEEPAQYAAKRFRNMRILEQDYLANPDDGQTLFYLGRLRHWHGQLTEAVRFLQRSIAQDPNGRQPTTLQSYTLVVDSFTRMHRERDALRVAEEALARFPDYIPLMFQQACMLFSAGRLAEAEIILRRLVRVPPEKWATAGVWPDIQGEKARVMLGRICHKQGRLADADAEFRLAIAHQPDSAEALFLLGQINLSLDRPQEAEQIAARLQQIADGQFECALLRAQVFTAYQRFEEAQRWIAEAISLRPDEIGAYVVLSNLLYREGRDLQRCIDVHARIAAVDPNQVDVRRRLQQLRTIKAQRAALAPVEEAAAKTGMHPAAAQLSNLGAGSGLAFSC